MLVQEPHADEPYVLERVRTEYRFEEDGTGRTSVEVEARPMSEAGVHQLGQLLHPYLGVRSRLVLEEMVVVRPDGSRREVREEQIRDLPAPVTAAFPIYSDVRVLHVTAPPLSPGDLLRYRLVNRLEHPDAPGEFWMEHRFRTGAIVLEETVLLDVPDDVDLRLEVKGEPEATVDSADGRRRYRWTTSRTEHAEASGASPVNPLALGPPDIQASSFRGWGEVADWLRGLWASRAAPDEALRQQAEGLVAGLERGRPQVEALYAFVSSEVRYLALELGLHRYQPLHASGVLDNGYGDCKDKHTLLAALLGAAGYEAYPVLVSVARDDPADEVPSPQPFDHVVTAVTLDGETLWLDSTSQVAPFGYLVPQIRGERGLRVADEARSGLVAIPESLPWPGEESFTVLGRVDDEGTLRASVAQSFRGDGEFAARAAVLNAPAPAWKQMIEAGVRSFAPEAQVRNLETGNPTAVADPFTVRFDLEVAGYLALVSDTERVKPLLPILRLPDLESTDEEEPLQLGTVRNVRTRFELTLPEGMTAQPPVPVAVERDFAAYRADYAADGRRLTVERHLRVSASEIAVEERRGYAALRSTLVSDMKQAFEIELGTAGGALADSSDLSRLEAGAARAVRDEDHERAARLYSRIVELSPDHETAWNELGEALFEAERHAEALEAFEKQLEVDPFHDSVRSWIARAHEELGDDERARELFRDQLDEFPLDRYANAQLGRLLVNDDRCDEAVRYLTSAVSIDGDDCASRRRLGRCQLELGEAERGASHLERVLESCGDWNVYWAGRAAMNNEQPELGMRLYRRAADRGYAAAQTQLGWSYAGGRGVPEDDALAVEWYRKAVAQNHPRAQANLGWMYDHGYGVPEDAGEAVRLYRRAAEGGNAFGQMRLGRAYEFGIGVERDLEQAARWYREAADDGNAYAQARLGELYRHGRGVERDLKLAKEWIVRAAEQGDSAAQLALSELYSRGEGVEADATLAREWAARAAEQGFPPAQLLLGGMLSNGAGGPADREAGYHWVEKAANAGYPAGMAGLGEMLEWGHGVEEDPAAAVEWARRAARQGSSRGQYNLGRYYLMGKGVEQDLVASYAWLRLASEDPAVAKDAREMMAALDLSEDQESRARALAERLRAEANPGR